MATKTLGTSAATSLTAIPWQGGPIASGGNVGNSDADIAAIAQSILDDSLVAGGAVPTGTTHTSTLVDSISAMTGIAPGYRITGSGIPPGTTIATVNVAGSSIVMSQAATASAAGVALLILPPSGFAYAAFSRLGSLYVPNRGILKMLPGDWAGVDASGWPILVSAEAIAFGNTSWSHS